MKKYLTVLKTSMTNEMEYRFNFFTSIAFSLIPFATNVLLWIAIYSGDTGSFSMSVKQIVTYYFCVFIVENLINNSVIFSIGAEIKNGDISKYLIKPCNYRRYSFCKAWAHNLLFCIIGIIPLTLVCVFLKDYICFQLSIFRVISFLVALVVGYMVNFYMNFLLSSLAFFISEVTSLFVTVDVLKGLVTGKVIPLSYFPGFISSKLVLTPFQFVCYLPVMILVGKYSEQTIIRNLVFGLGWVIILFVLCKFAWKKGMQRYSSFGG